MSALLAIITAAAANPVDLELVGKAQIGQSKPALVLQVNQAATDLSVSLTCGGSTGRHSGPAGAGERVVIEVDPPQGSHACSGALSAVFADGSEGEMPLSFTVQVLPPLVVKVAPDAVDLEKRTVAVTMDRPAGRVEVRAYGPEGQVLGEGVAPGEGAPPGQAVTAQWSGAGEVIRVEVRGFDTDGFWAAVDLFPWYYNIPHEDVVFATNEAVIRPAEEPKLTAALAQIREVERKYGTFAAVNLYIAGYTDTVGDAGANQGLSERRAKAIAAWFSKQGLSGEIWYQGFGESALAVPTADNVDEAANRRAVYVVAAQPPPRTAELPRGDWKKL
ncbi:MAG: OmpA family protein [Alphaproteobacteria bacterium]|nr:OmpA family protein [Alphaproteobacteria bacterium]